MANALAHVLHAEFGSKIATSSATYAGPQKGAFEVTVDGKLIHSKLKLGHGKVQSDEELDAILDHIGDALERRAAAKAAASADADAAAGSSTAAAVQSSDSRGT